MHIVCPLCFASYGISPAALGEAGRTVRCARCKETWLARPEDAVEAPPPPPMPEAGASTRRRDVAAEWDEAGRDERHTPVVESPPIAGDWQEEGSSGNKEDWIALVREASGDDESEPPAPGD